MTWAHARFDSHTGRVDCNSSHHFCFECIHRWGQDIENSCPLCKQSFHRIDKLVRAPKDVWAGRRLSVASGGASEEGRGDQVMIANERWKLLSSVAVQAKKQRVEDMVCQQPWFTPAGVQLCAILGSLHPSIPP